MSATPLAGAFGGWIAYGVARINNPAIKHWQVLFVIEGLLTILYVATQKDLLDHYGLIYHSFGVLCIWVLPDRPHNTKWLTPRERDVADWRMMKDGNRTHGKIVWSVLLKQLADWKLWLNIAIYMVCPAQEG